MGAQFSEEFLLGYHAGHRDGFTDAVVLMRDAVTRHQQTSAVTRRVQQITHLLTGDGLFPASGPAPEAAHQPPAGKAQ